MRWWLLGLLLLFAVLVRTHQLDGRVMHGDEANQAVKAGVLLETGEYRFDPRDHHGPTLYYLTLPVAWLRGESTLVELSEVTVRLVPLIAGVLAIALVAMLAVPAGGPAAALGAALLLAVAPAAVYFSRYYIQETLLLAFTLAAFASARTWWRRGGGWGWAVVTGACVGLMQASKASAPLFLLAAVAGLIAARPRNATPAPSPVLPWRRDLPVTLVSAAAVAALFYSSFFTHAAGLRDTLLTYLPAGDRVTSGGGHTKPWDYYLGLFWPQTIGGYKWSQLPFLLLALGGASASLWAPAPQRPALRFWTVYTAVVGVVFSVIPYKTPWLVIHLLPGFAALGGGLAGAVASRGKRGLVVAVVLLVLTAASQWRQLDLAVYLRPGDARNPLAYVHPSPDVRKVRPLIEESLARHPDLPVRIISQEVWPLPWYLRGVDRVGYWTEVPDDCDGALVLCSADQADAVRSRLDGDYSESFLGLRPGFVLVVFTRQP
jgi:uncharacterized protein (TIGR03663 family)